MIKLFAFLELGDHLWGGGSLGHVLYEKQKSFEKKSSSKKNRQKRFSSTLSFGFQKMFMIVHQCRVHISDGRIPDFLLNGSGIRTRLDPDPTGSGSTIWDFTDPDPVGDSLEYLIFKFTTVKVEKNMSKVV